LIRMNRHGLQALARDCDRLQSLLAFIALSGSPTATAPFSSPPCWVELALARTDPCPSLSSLNAPLPPPARTEPYHRAALTTLRAVLSRASEIHLQSALATDSEFREEALRIPERRWDSVGDGRYGWAGLARNFYSSVFSDRTQGERYYERTEKAFQDAVVKLRRKRNTT
jgi:hypothetical protein